MGKAKYATTKLKGPVPRVRFNLERRDDGRSVGEVAMPMLVGPNGEELPGVMNRLMFYCRHGEAAPDWHGIAAISWRGRGSVQIRCDICHFTARLQQRDLHHLLAMGQHDEEAKAAFETVTYEGRNAAYQAVNLRLAAPLALRYREIVAAERAAEDEEDITADS